MIYSLDLLLFDELFTFSLLAGRFVTRPLYNVLCVEQNGLICNKSGLLVYCGTLLLPKTSQLFVDFLSGNGNIIYR